VRALIATIPPGRGGVPAMLRTVLALLAERGIEAEVAWYEPYRMTPRLSVPAFRLGARRPSAERREVPGAAAGWAIGAWLPELEFTHYRPTPVWRERIAAADLHLVVSGSCLAALAFERTGTPFLAWVATDWEGDRTERVRTFPAARRVLDRLLVAPVCRRLERRLLQSGCVLALSEPTRASLERVAGAGVVGAVLSPAIDTGVFHPADDSVVPGRIGFVGRFDDPRKNLPLFLETLAAVRRAGEPVTALVIGGASTPQIETDLARHGLLGCVELLPYLDAEPLAERLRSCDLVAVTAHQEGLGIAALEAMASGCPLVSTRCGGPEEFVRAARIVEVSRDRALRSRLSAAARRTVEIGYSLARARAILGGELESLMAARKGLAGV